MKKNYKLYMPPNHMEELYNSKNKLVKFVHCNRLSNIKKIIDKYQSSNGEILDAGCGEGHLLEYIYKSNKNHSFFGVDITKNAINSAKERCSFAEIVLGDIFSTKYQSNKFDVIICTEVLEHIPEYTKITQELLRILKPKGLLIITFPNELLWTISRFILRRKPVKVPDHYNSFSPRKIKKIFQMKILKKKGMPFPLPFFLSLGYLMVFKKDKS